ncbi:Y-family DNA polymerase [Bosea lathyri]|uniref:Protein ImuB n=1 Tax=Bosea lathyri TaxID=1036778 RepID=A0A1H6CYB6_9HYPH|nr:DNA polymerase Y family protein [Bosea lathyri]SEG78060.1 protein ImuB [Bosea lathyri]
MPRRYLALWFPFLPIDRLRWERRIPACAGRVELPVVVVETQQNALRLVDCDQRAVALGLTRGLTLADARARIPDLTVIEAEPEADQRFLDRLAAFCDRFTPLVALDPPHGLILDITGCAHLFGGEAALQDAIGARLRQIGLSLRSAVAGTPDAARAISRFGRGGIVPPGADEATARPLPIAALGVTSETVIALSRAGLKTLADLADRPSSALSARFGEEEVATRLRRTLGREDRRITPLRPPPDCVVERHFAEPLLDMGGLETVVTRLIAEAARVLELRGEGGRAFEVSFFRTDGAVRRLMVETGRPSRDAKAILRLYRERLDTVADPLDPGFGFDAVRLAVPVCEPLNTHQPSLDGRAVEDEAVADLVDRLVARFGRDRVLRFVAQDSHDPLRAAKAISAAAKLSSGTAWPAPAPDEPPTRPLQLFEPPQPVEAIAEVPDGPPIRFRWRRLLHDVARAEGPERIAPEWWRDGSGEPMRDYYRVEDAQGRRFWLFRVGFYEPECEPPRWFLHGLFA